MLRNVRVLAVLLAFSMLSTLGFARGRHGHQVCAVLTVSPTTSNATAVTHRKVPLTFSSILAACELTMLTIINPWLTQCLRRGAPIRV
jgi:hypothetical protein